MSTEARPIVVAFDGSAEAEAAVRAAASLFQHHPLVVVSVWEPGLAMAVLTYPDATGVTYIPPSPEESAAIDRAEREHATSAAEAGAALARDLGATAESLPVPDSLDVAQTLAGVAEERDAAAVVVGSRGLGRAKAALLGSTSRRLMHETRRPVLVVRAPE